MRMIPASAIPLGLLLALSACGERAALKPQAGKSLPVAPYGQEVRPSAEALLTAPPQAAPKRSVELRQRSEDRSDDPFDLPPATN